MTQSPIFFLYGEAPKVAAADFLHLETLDARSRPAQWHIRPHLHDDLHHIFVLCSGAGDMRCGGRSASALAPCLLMVPAREEHTFAFLPETTGHVLTISDAFLRQLCSGDAEFAGLFAGARVLSAGSEADSLVGYFDRLARELAWRAPGHASAVKATLLHILVTALRLERQDIAPPKAGSGDARLVALLRDRIESRFRTHEGIGAYAAALGVSVSRLRTACRRQGSGAPQEMVQARRMLEAKRALLYGVTSVAEIAFSLGYEDVSYFVRVFRQSEGVSPRRFRQMRMER